MNYTEQANKVLKIARDTARKLNHPYVGTEHLLLGLREVYTGVAGQVLGMNGVDEESIRKVVDELVCPVGETAVARHPETSPRLTYILEESMAEAAHFRSDKIGHPDAILVDAFKKQRIAITCDRHADDGRMVGHIRKMMIGQNIVSRADCHIVGQLILQIQIAAKEAVVPVSK